MLDISTVGLRVSAPQKATLETSRRKLSEDVWFGIGTTLLVGCRAIELGKMLQGV